jgi:predicted HTH domain antitoxin
MAKTLKLAVPDEVAGTPFEKEYLETVSLILKEQAVLRLYREHKISTGRGAKMLRMSIHDFIQFLSAHQVSIFNYAEGELEADVEAALEASQNRRSEDP